MEDLKRISGRPLKVYDSAIVFEEIPDETVLALNISNCPGYCSECSEPWLLEDVGEELTNEVLQRYINDNPDITCICFMGGDSNHDDVIRCCKYIREHTTLKTAIYSGFEFINMEMAKWLNYYKIGRWIMPQGDPKDWWKTNCGVLQFPFSNQLLFENIGGRLFNITYKFREKPLGSLESYIIRPENN